MEKTMPVDNYKSAYLYRLKDAQVLRDNQRPEGSIYLGGYAIECVLKYAHQELLGINSKESHQLSKILKEIIEYRDLKGASLRYLKDLDSVNNIFKKSKYIKHWETSLRYQGKFEHIIKASTPADYKNQTNTFCTGFINEVETICNNIRASVDEHKGRGI